jgi:hypothetical protein
VETTKKSINQQMDNQNAVYPYNGKLFAIKKIKGNTCYNIDQPQKYYAK